MVETRERRVAKDTDARSHRLERTGHEQRLRRRKKKKKRLRKEVAGRNSRALAMAGGNAPTIDCEYTERARCALYAFVRRTRGKREREYGGEEEEEEEK